MELPPEDLEESLTLQKCAEMLATFRSLEGLHKAFRLECNPVAWCNRLFGLLIQDDQSSIFDTLLLLPDQKGNFRKRKDLRLDSGIDEELKDISELLGLSIRDGLLHKEITSPEIHQLLQTKTQNDVLAEIGRHFGEQAKSKSPLDTFRHGNVRLFAMDSQDDYSRQPRIFPGVNPGTTGVR